LSRIAARLSAAITRLAKERAYASSCKDPSQRL
jgi:hypothetical protein